MPYVQLYVANIWPMHDLYNLDYVDDLFLYVYIHAYLYMRVHLGIRTCIHLAWLCCQFVFVVVDLQSGLRSLGRPNWTNHSKRMKAKKIFGATFS